MKTENLQVKYDAEKLSTLRLYMKKTQVDLNGELEKCLDRLCEKHIPKDVRELFELRKQEQTTRPARPPRPRPNDSGISGQQEQQLV